MPKKDRLCSMEEGSLYNLTAFSMCAHNGTHIDAPYHFINEGKSVDQIPLFKIVGLAFVAECSGILTASDAEKILERAMRSDPESAKRVLIKGKAVVSKEAASVFAAAGIYLLGNESQTVGPEDSPMDVHLILLEAETVLLEGIRLNNVAEGVYLLNAAPLSLEGSDGSPCRAILLEL